MTGSSQRGRSEIGQFRFARWLLLTCLGGTLALNSGCAILGAALGSHVGSKVFNHVAGEIAGRAIGNLAGRALDKRFAQVRETPPPTIDAPAVPMRMENSPAAAAPQTSRIAPIWDGRGQTQAPKAQSPAPRPLVFESRPAWPPPVNAGLVPSKG